MVQFFSFSSFFVWSCDLKSHGFENLWIFLYTHFSVCVDIIFTSHFSRSLKLIIIIIVINIIINNNYYYCKIVFQFIFLVFSDFFFLIVILDSNFSMIISNNNL